MASWLIAYARRLVPQMSATEREALEAGTVWADREPKMYFGARLHMRRLGRR